MKRFLILIIALSVLMLTSITAYANDWHHGDRNDQRYNHRYGDDRNWRNTHHYSYEDERNMPFKWHDNSRFIRERHHLVRIHDYGWDHRFPGVVAYRWNGNGGFWHHGHYVTDAVFFFDSNDRLVSVGYMHDGVFIHFREDHEVYENHDSFFISWWRH